jgi:thiamine-phosphate pyrophosphorylase
VRPRLDLSLYLVTDRLMCARLGLETVTAAAVAGGVTAVQLRDDDTPATELVEIARRLCALLAPTGVPLIVNNHLEVALAAEAAGAHVGQADASPEAARRLLGPDRILGLSITDQTQFAAIAAVDIDYLGVGPIFATATKSDAAPAMGLDGLAAVRAATPLPIVAIGGIDLDNAAAAVRAGADGVAVVSAICGASDPGRAAATLAACVSQAKCHR